MKTRKKNIPLPRYWKVAISRLTGLHFCDRECDCGSNNQLWWFPTGGLPGQFGVPDWVPGWMNGADTDSVWRWLVENDKHERKTT